MKKQQEDPLTGEVLERINQKLLGGKIKTRTEPLPIFAAEQDPVSGNPQDHPLHRESLIKELKEEFPDITDEELRAAGL